MLKYNLVPGGIINSITVCYKHNKDLEQAWNNYQLTVIALL